MWRELLFYNKQEIKMVILLSYKRNEWITNLV
jgi:hypothetical protein